ncbi:MAG: hypothetical protein U0457_06775 [Candidatus Sericytochromatia bacterium]
MNLFIQNSISLFSLNVLAKENNIKKIEGFSAPESVIEFKDNIYVSNVGKKLEPSTKDGDGFISKLSINGKVLEKNFLPKKGFTLNAPKGMAIIKNVLYVADIDRIVAFDLKSGKMLSEISLEKTGTKFLNDITIKDENTLLVSSTDLGKIFSIDISKKNYTELALKEILVGVNGLVYKNNILYFNTFPFDNSGKKGITGTIDLKTNKIEKISGLEGFFDGLVYNNDKLIFSDWDAMDKGGKIISYDLKTKEKKDINVGIKGNADIFYSEKHKKLLIPAMMEGNLYILDLK